MSKRFPLWVALLLAGLGGAQAQTFSLEGAIIDSRTSQNLGVVSERGDVNTLFRAQKAMTFGILRSAGISLEQLPPDVRARIERFATTNLDAFRAFSQGLDLKDQGKFIEAKAFFRRAAELDPGFGLAAEQQQSMPDVNLGVGVQTRAVIMAAAGAAVDRGKASFAVDTARAVAAIAAGQTVVSATIANAEPATTFNYANQSGTGPQGGVNLVAGLAYTLAPSAGVQVGVASAAEYKTGDYNVTGGALEALGNNSTPVARRGAAVNVPGGSAAVGANVAFWGSWLSTPTASATAVVTGRNITAPELGQVDYVVADATRQMPGAGTASFTPTGGSLGSATGNIVVNFATRDVELRNLGFAIGTQTYAGLAGTTRYSDTIASGTFSGNYTAGTCAGAGCTGFTFAGSRYGGSFVGRTAEGLIFSTFMNSGTAGVHLFKQP